MQRAVHPVSQGLCHPSLSQPAAAESPALSQLPENGAPAARAAPFTCSTLPSAEMLRPGFSSKGRPSRSQASRGGGTALPRHRSSRAWPSSTDTFCSSPTMSGGTAPTKHTLGYLGKALGDHRVQPSPSTVPRGNIHRSSIPPGMATPPLPWEAVPAPHHPSCEDFFS